MSAEDQEDNDEIPPLEDMSKFMTRKLSIGTKSNEYLETESNEEIRKKRDKQIEDLLITKETGNEAKPSLKKHTKSDTYCGFKKGFLTNSKLKDKKKTSEKITEIKKKEKVKDSKVFPEVQEALNNSIPLLQSKDWVTDDLLQRIMKNPKLAKQFSDPKFNEASQLFQTNPKKVIQMAENNPELKEFIQEFCGLMGEHFTKLGEAQDAKKEPTFTSKSSLNTGASEEDQKKMKSIISNPEVASILQSADIQKLFTLLRSNPDAANRFLKNADTTLILKVQKLIDVGLLQFGPGL